MSLQIGQKAPDFNLSGVDGESYCLDSFTGKKALVVIFTCNHCPYAQAYEDRIKELQLDYGSKGVQVVAICSNDSVQYADDSFENMKLRARQKSFNFPYLHDETQMTAKLYGARCTPHAFLLDQNRVLKYKGRIDDNWQSPKDVSRQDLREAMDAVLSGKLIAIFETSPMGCSIKWK